RASTAHRGGVGGTVTLLHGAGADDDVEPGLGERERTGASYSAARTGDDGDGSVGHDCSSWFSTCVLSAATSAISQASTTFASRRGVITAWSMRKLRPVPSTPPKGAVIVPDTITRAISTSPSPTTSCTSCRSSGI